MARPKTIGGRHKRGPFDIEIGKRIRVRRKLLGMTQRTLGDALGVTWQQVHKFESGLNRVGTSRLAALSDALGVPILYFLRDELVHRYERMPSDVMERPETLKLMRLYYAIRDETVRRHVLSMVEAVAKVSAPPSEVLEPDDEVRAG